MMIQIALGALLMASQTSALTAGEFLNRAEPLMKKSKMSLIFSKEARYLLGEVGASADRTRAKLESDRAAGRPVTTCLPPKGKAKLDANEFIAYVRALPPAQKAQSLDAAFAGHVARKYPCRA